MNADTVKGTPVVKSPPFRADHVGSLLRPRRLKEARERILGPKPDFAPLDQLGVSPQCGFSSSVHGNPLTETEEEAKLARLVEVARDVWSSV